MMWRSSIRKRDRVATAVLAAAITLVVPALAQAQTTPPPKKPAATTPAKPTAAKPTNAVATPTNAAKPVPATATGAAKSPATSTVNSNGQAASQVAHPASQTAPVNSAPAGTHAATPASTASPTTTGTTSATGAAGAAGAASTAGTAGGGVPASSYAGGAPAGGAAGGDGRAPVAVQGIGSFLYGDWTGVVYGCFRTGNGTRLLCDFDTSKQNGVQVNANQLWSGLNLVDNGGKITGRHNAFFVGDDGSQFPNGYISTSPVRTMFEYDDVAANITSVTLVWANQRVQGIPIYDVDPSQPAGTIPSRAAAAGHSAQGAAGAPVDKAQQGLDNVNNQINNVNDQKKKAKSLWDQLKATGQNASGTNSKQ